MNRPELVGVGAVARGGHTGGRGGGRAGRGRGHGGIYVARHERGPLRHEA